MNNALTGKVILQNSDSGSSRKLPAYDDAFRAELSSMTTGGIFEGGLTTERDPSWYGIMVWVLGWMEVNWWDSEP